MGREGHEFGATTGRPRRCGWIDLVQLRYSIMINGVTELCMMKGDVLSGLDKIKVCTHYQFNGEQIDYLPFEANDGLIPIFKELPGWQEDLMQLQDLNDAPQSFHDYIRYLEKELETPISIVSVGPDRKQTFFR